MVDGGGSAGMPEKAEWLARFIGEVIDWAAWTFALTPLLAGVVIGLVTDGWLIFGLFTLILFSLVGLLLSLAIVAYVSLTYRNGRSFGKRVMGTQVVRVDGSPVSWAYNFWLRTFLTKGIIMLTIGSMTSGLLFIGNYLWPLWDRDSQSLHDKMVGTIVVKALPPRQAFVRFRS